MKKHLYTLFVAIILVPVSGLCQNDTVIFTPLGQYNFPLWQSTYKPIFNTQGAPYVYAACKEYGLVTMDINNVNAPVPVNTIAPTSFGTLKPTYVQQENNLLYVALGDFMGSGQNAGFAILDVTTPQSPVILDQWDTTAWVDGVSSIKVVNGYAYVCAMESGLIILDVSTSTNIQFVSHFMPDTTQMTMPYAPTARGCDYRNDTLLLAFDCGGLRVLDVSNKLLPVELGQYVNLNLTAVANAAYNEVVWVGDYAYVPVDYCGLEVIDVSNPASMSSMAWNNPWNCIGLSWFGSDGHANQIVHLPNEQIVMVSAGDSEVMVFDASDPAQPDIIGGWGPPNDTAGAWGLDVRGGMVVVGRADVPVNQPFIADTGGIKLLSWQLILSTPILIPDQTPMTVYPNPASANCTVAWPASSSAKQLTVEVVDVTGRIVGTQLAQADAGQIAVDLSTLESGSYFIRVYAEDVFFTQEVIRQ